ncbi:hypothetical protein XFF6992_440063 [Xanthomonas citri pv. fuscans]|nr:hypothetical protein XFF6992_440063 [Xanthomonas citri pv. fuscans]SOO33976.1 hypothetical protein XFF6994_3330005 [Xanthomonas citri pv. fuscans]
MREHGSSVTCNASWISAIAITMPMEFMRSSSAVLFVTGAGGSEVRVRMSMMSASIDSVWPGTSCSPCIEGPRRVAAGCSAVRSDTSPSEAGGTTALRPGVRRMYARQSIIAGRWQHDHRRASRARGTRGMGRPAHIDLCMSHDGRRFRRCTGNLIRVYGLCANRLGPASCHT